LITRNVNAYQYFIESLILTGNTHIANVLEPGYAESEPCGEMIKRERSSFLKEHQSTSSTAAAMATNIFSHDNEPISCPIKCTQDEENGMKPIFSQYNDSGLTPLMRRLFHNGFNSIGQSPPLINSFQQQCSQHQLPPCYPMNLNHHYSFFKLSNQNVSSSGHSSSSRSSSLSHSISPSMSRSRSTSVTTTFMSSRNHTNSNFTSNPMVPRDETIARRALSPNPNANMDNSDQLSPFTSYMLSLPSTYNIEWSDVNNVGVNFCVYRSVPNIRKQLNSDEVTFFGFWYY
jgi:hypothetical protein